MTTNASAVTYFLLVTFVAHSALAVLARCIDGSPYLRIRTSSLDRPYSEKSPAVSGPGPAPVADYNTDSFISSGALKDNANVRLRAKRAKDPLLVRVYS